jgi:hypothetical protein
LVDICTAIATRRVRSFAGPVSEQANSRESLA